MSDIRDALIIFFLGLFALAVILPNSSRDDSDPDGGHSGLHVYTDHLTGIQYLGAFGSMTPRLNADGSIHRVAK